MSLLYLDSFDHYATADLAEKGWSASGATWNITAAAGRHSSAALRMNDTNGTLSRSLVPVPGSATCVIGFSFKPTSLQVADIASVTTTGGANQFTLQLLSDGNLLLYRGSTSNVLVQTVTAPFTAGSSHYVELKVLIHQTLGTAELRIDGITAASGTNLDTANQATADWTGFRFGGGFGGIPGWLFDDLYILDSVGPAPLNDFLGDVRVDARYPTAEGASAAWTPFSGTDNALMVDETAPDDDTTYNTAAAVGLTDTHVVEDAPVVGATLLGVQLVVSAKKSDAGTCTLAPVVRHSTTNYPGTAFNPGTSYAYATTPYGTNPGTGAAWTEADFNAAQFGYTRTA